MPRNCFSRHQNNKMNQECINISSIRDIMQPKYGSTWAPSNKKCRVNTYFLPKNWKQCNFKTRCWDNIGESESSVWATSFSLLSPPATMLSCSPPLKPCSLHPIHRITRDAGVSIATAVQAVATGLWWGLVAVMCVCECMCGCLRAFVRERHGKTKNTWEFVPLFYDWNWVSSL